MASRKTLVKFRETDEEEYDVEPTKTVKKRKSQPSKKPKKGTSKVQKLLLMVLFFIILLLSLAIYLIYRLNISDLKNYLAKNVEVSMDSIMVNVESLRQNKTKFTINLRIKNNLFCSILADSANFDMKMGSMKMSENTLLAKINYNMKSAEDIKVPVIVNIDSYLAKRVLQKSIETNTEGFIKNLLKNGHVSNNVFSGDLKGVTTVNGKLNMVLSVLGLNIPFEKNIIHN